MEGQMCSGDQDGEALNLSVCCLQLQVDEYKQLKESLNTASNQQHPSAAQKTPAAPESHNPEAQKDADADLPHKDEPGPQLDQEDSEPRVTTVVLIILLLQQHGNSSLCLPGPVPGQGGRGGEAEGAGGGADGSGRPASEAGGGPGPSTAAGGRG